MDYIAQAARLRQLSELMKDRKPLLETPANLCGLEQVKKNLAAELKTQGFIKFRLGNIEVKNGMVVDFVVHDERGRNSNSTRLALNKAIKNFLKDSNWSLMTEGVSGYLGVFRGRIKGVEFNDSMYSGKGEIIKF